MRKMIKDIRWIQRYSNFKKALSNLGEAVELANERELSKLEKQGLIQSFEYTYELAWITIRDFYRMLSSKYKSPGRGKKVDSRFYSKR